MGSLLLYKLLTLKRRLLLYSLLNLMRRSSYICYLPL